MAKPVFTNATTIVAHEGSTVRLYKDQAWADNDPFVKANKGLFSDQPSELRRSAPEDPVVEQATAAPGEKRRTRAR